MIFKAKQGDTDKWFYYDNITLFKHKWIYRPYPRPSIDADEVCLLPDEPLNLQSDVNGQLENVLMCDLNFASGSTKTIYVYEAYLLNDEGKTIERL